jgi:hypothetical protein
LSSSEDHKIKNVTILSKKNILAGSHVYHPFGRFAKAPAVLAYALENPLILDV